MKHLIFLIVAAPHFFLGALYLLLAFALGLVARALCRLSRLCEANGD
jgi:hypothetical protein